MGKLAKFVEGQGASPAGLPELCPKTIKDYRRELRKGRTQATLGGQKKLGKLVIGVSSKILTSWPANCRCSEIPVGTPMPDPDPETGSRAGGRVNALCQACKRVHWALETFVELERITTERLRIDVSMLKLSAKPSAEGSNPAVGVHAMVEMVRDHNTKRQEEAKAVKASPSQDLAINDPPVPRIAASA